ncbi:hypothetical protein SAMN05216184_10493 [Georgenia satyanarayanai]|uniref:Virus ReqiPepy6 Gp37-like protein n=1 Tax=Georgenia satyanarayanai TaxID=860221 RepID=A0A2Y9ACS2_9MICO|nr:hypothetical protein [Georgenia satyanarayanai]PYG00154.1 hypothetical protein A8987_10493 [Georgenia satyanarayanai]SSA40369.1 hypothetical protein SAMN05216184_10493 [Georgenia satyanarayanai]
MTWRYIAQRIPSGEFLHWDLPLTDVQVTPALNAPGGLGGSIPFAVAALLGEDGQPLIKPWHTAIWAEAGGQIRGGGIVTSTPLTDDGQALQVRCTGLSGALIARTPWTATYRRYLQTDPLDIVRDIFAHVQSFPAGALGLVVDDTTSPVTVGVPEDPGRRAARLRAEETKATLDEAKTTLDKAKALLDTTTKAALRAAGLTDMTGKVVVAELDKDGKEPSKTKKNLWYRPSKNRAHKVAGTPAAWVSVPAALADARKAAAATTAHDQADKAYDAAKTVNDKTRKAFQDVQDRQDEDPFLINSWSTHDLGKVVDDLATDTPFDMVEHTEWVGDQLVHRLELAYPRRGARRNDLRYVIGENVAVPREAAWGDDYASDVQVFGAGEGHKMVRSMQSTAATGMRRVHTHTDKTVTTAAAADQRARVLAPTLRGGLRITELTVYDHPHAPVGAVQLGDEIRLMGRLDWAEVDMWLRVMAITYTPDGPAVIKLRVTPSTEGA